VSREREKRLAMVSSGDRGVNRLAELFEPLVSGELFTASLLQGVKLFRSDKSIPRRPMIYEPSIIIIAQGHKIVYLGDEVYRYDPYNYLVLSVPLPLDCETVATPEEPVLGVSISVDAATVSELLIEMDDSSSISGSVPRGIYSTPLTDEMVDATARLLRSLSNPPDARILGPQIVREIIYRVLCGEQGGALRSLATRHSRFSQIAKVLKRMHSEFGADIDIGTLADEASMSVSAFHSNFKAVTGASPLQYLKRIRLHRARTLIAQHGLGVGIAAGNVGYESVSQFSREFKRYFGHTPTDAAATPTFER
jgi:AraC-like DNA-binding protein